MTTSDILQVCEDCVIVGANGLDGAVLADGHEARYEHATRVHGGEPIAMLDDDGSVRGGFSKYPCEFCGATDWGSRYDATLHTAPVHVDELTTMSDDELLAAIRIGDVRPARHRAGRDASYFERDGIMRREASKRGIL